jgi:hypothetical protein
MSNIYMYMKVNSITRKQITYSRDRGMTCTVMSQKKTQMAKRHMKTCSLSQSLEMIHAVH